MRSILDIPLLGDDPDAPFPPPHHALRFPNGLLAWGGGLEPARLLRAYHQGTFPWYSEDQPVLWWNPAPRCVIFPERVHVSRRTRRRYRSGVYRLSADQAFREVVRGCAAPRGGEESTWITQAMIEAYTRLHELGHAHSVEVWAGEKLVGGIYGVALGRAFFGESMFSRQTDASKIALAALCHQLRCWNFGVLDCQVANPHLFSLGAEEIPRGKFQRLLARLVDHPGRRGSWQAAFKVPEQL